jgi:hypothetical protein
MFPSAQKFAADGAEFFENLFDLAVILQIGFHLLLGFCGNVIHLWSSPGLTDGQVILGAVAAPLRTFASGLATALVSLDQRTA